MEKELRVKGIYGSGMVLQRDKINCIYGSGDVFSDVIMSFRGVTSITQVDENGNWKFEFSPGEAGGPFVMSIKSDAQKIEFSDIYVGEVWLNAGGGNGALSMGEMKYSYPEEFYLPGNLNIRMINVPANFAFGEKIDYIENPVWNYASPESLESMSGLGYFFAKKLSVDLSVPVGIVNVAYENAPIISWISKRGIEEMGDKKADLGVLAEYEGAGASESCGAGVTGADESCGAGDRARAVSPAVAKALSIDEEIALWQKELSKELPSADFGSSSGWSSCVVPGSIDDFESNGLIWFKKEFELSAKELENFGLLDAHLWLGVINCPSEVFLNGRIVGSVCGAGSYSGAGSCSGAGYGTCYGSCSGCGVSKACRFDVPTSYLKAGKNEILIKVQKSSKSVSFVADKKYCLFSNNYSVAPAVCRNIECQDLSLAPIDGEYISLEGQWSMKVGMITANAPSPDILISKPCAIYNGVLPACFKFALAGVIWCHGEDDLERAQEYRGLLTKLITVWRRRFTFWSKDLPFIIVQLPGWARNGVEGDYSSNSDMAVIRKAQAAVSSVIEKVGLVVTIDAGEWNDKYAEKKATIGTRCEFEALRLAYSKHFISPAPRYSSIEHRDNKFVVKFECGNSSLHTFKVEGLRANLSLESSDCIVYGFTVVGNTGAADVVSLPAKAKLVNANTVEVEIPDEIKNVSELRYLWADCPAPINLYSRDMIPAAPFGYKL